MSSDTLQKSELWGPRETLDRCELFAGARPEILDLLASQATLRHYPAGAVLFEEGEPGEEAFVLARGTAEVVKKTPRQRDVVLAVLEASACAGEMAVLLTGQPRSATLRASTDLDAYAIGATALRTAVRNDANLAASLGRRMEQLGVDAFLKMASPFVHLAPAAIYELAGKMHRRKVLAGETLMRQGEAGDTFCLVKSGRMEVLRGSDGSGGTQAAHVVAQLGPGDCFGEAALLTEQPRSATVRALEAAEVLELNRADFDATVKEHQSARAFFRELSLARYRVAPKQLLAAADPIATLLPRLQPSQAGRVLMLFGGGLLLLALLSAASILLPNIRAFQWITLAWGGLLPAVSYVAYIRERHLLNDIPVVMLLIISAVSAAVAVPLAIFLQQVMAPQTQSHLAAALLTAATEEPLKLIPVLWVLSRRQYRFALDGVIFGITAAMGFGGLESLGYGLFGLSRPQVLCQTFNGAECMVQTLWLRIFTTFLGHGPWTAILVAMIFRERGRAGRTFTPPVILAFLMVVVLHTLWDFNLVLFGIPVALVGIFTLRHLMEEGVSHQAAALSSLSLLPANASSSSSGDSVECVRCHTRFPAAAIYCVRCGLALA